MSELINIPTVEQINLEHRLANSKASEAVQHATNCGLMLLQVKASKQHGEWLPWLKQQQENGLIEFSDSTAKRYMRVAANRSRVTDLESPSIRAALELLADKEPDEQQGTLIDAEAERQARIKAEQEMEEWKTRQKETQQESNNRRKTIRELETQIDLLKSEKVAPEVRIETPSDYEATKQKVSLLAGELDNLKKHQASIVQSQVTAKLKERERELAELDSKIKGAEAVLKGLQEGLDRYSNKQRELQVHLDAIEKARVAMAMLAANLEGFEAVIDHDNELRLWRALSQMLRNGAEAIDYFVGDAKPRLAA